MPIVTVVIGILLTGLGAWGWFGQEAGHQSMTAWIPAFLGVPLIVLGLLAFKESLLKHTMHLAAVLGLFGLIAAASRLAIKGRVEGRAGISQAIMTVLCAIFLALCVNSFIQARRRRRAREALAQTEG